MMTAAVIAVAVMVKMALCTIIAVVMTQREHDFMTEKSLKM
jgi:hypothetical protein